MNLKCKINGKEYPIVQGNTFSEEYNETLDSGSIIISQVEKIEDIQPYDDVYFFDNEFNGYGRYKKEYKDTIKLIEEQSGDFWLYVSIPDEFFDIIKNKNVFEYKIKIILMEKENEYDFINKYCDCFIMEKNNQFYLSIPAIDFEEKIVKSSDNDEYWVLSTLTGDSIRIGEIGQYTAMSVEEFYVIAQYDVNNNGFYKHLLIDDINRDIIRLEDKTLYQYTILLCSETKKLETIPLPNFSVTQPLDISLKKSVYNYIVDIVDMYSPVYKVVDNEEFGTWKYQKKYIVDSSLKEIFGNVYSPDFTLNNPNLRDVLSQLMIVKDMIPYVEDDVIKAMDITKRNGNFDTKGVSFVKSNLTSNNYCTSLKRTYSDALSEEKSCRLTEFLSFRNSESTTLTLSNMAIETTYPIYRINKLYMCYYKKIRVKNVYSNETVEKAFLCKQDISKLIKLNSERNVLSEDWTSFNEKNVRSVDDLSKFKISTIGYDIGSKRISGWGEQYTSYALFNWFPKINTYLQKIFEFMDETYPYGIYNYSYLRNNSGITYDEIIEVVDVKNGGFISAFTNEYPAGLKGLMFEIEYEPFYNGTLYHSKDNLNRDDIVVNDNSSSSLTLLEQDGIMQKEKINRFGNEVFQINARYNDIKDLQPLGSVYESKDGKDTDIIIYSREYAVQDNVINCRYLGAKDYVLKNYFTSVYAKHRPYNLMSYAESVYRAENKKVFLLLDLDKKVIEKNNKGLSFKNFSSQESDSDGSIKKILSFVKETIVGEKMNFLNKDKINYGFYELKGSKYASDVNVFTSANSLCFNLKMYDNVSAGIYVDVENLEPDFQLFNVKNDIIGGIQQWYLTVDNEKTGFIEEMGFYVGHIEKDQYILDKVIDDIEDINAKEKKVVKTLNSKLGLDSGNNEILVPGDDIETKVIDVLKDETIYKKIFELPKINIVSEKINNLIGNNFLLKKDNKELIDMTFQLEAISSNEKILFSPWIMRLSDLNGNYNKFHKNAKVDGDDDGLSSIQVPIKLYQGTLVKLKTVNQFPYYIDKPLMILSFDENRLNKNQDTVNLEQMLEEKGSVECPVTFEYYDYPYSVFPGSSYYTKPCSGIKKYIFNGQKINKYDKEKGEIEFEGVQQIIYVDINDSGTSLEKGSVEKRTLTFKLVSGSTYRGVNIPQDENWFVFDGLNQKINFNESHNSNYFLCSDSKFMVVREDYENIERIENFDDTNAKISDGFFVGVTDFTYNQNMFVTTSNEPMKKHHVYNQYKDLREIGLSDYNTGPLVSNVFYFVEDDKLVVDLYNFEHKMDEVKSVQLWYRDEGGALNFVFGVNVDEEDFNKRRLEIHISLITHKDMRVFDKFHNVIGEVKNVANSEDVDDLTKQKYEKYIEK